MNRDAWDDYPRTGKCEVCGKRGPVTRHHVVHRQHVRDWCRRTDRVSAAWEWDPANSMLIGDRYGRCTCHAMHHSAGRRIPFEKVPSDAIVFAVKLMGKAAMPYFRRFYAT